jgi:hypothetical protein
MVVRLERIAQIVNGIRANVGHIDCQRRRRAAAFVMEDPRWVNAWLDLARRSVPDILTTKPDFVAEPIRVLRLTDY